VFNGAYDVVEGGIYFLERVGGTGAAPDRRIRLQYFDLATRKVVTTVDDLGPVALGLSASRDGRTIFFTRVESSADELMLVDDFR
jgi:hypothetical protein